MKKIQWKKKKNLKPDHILRKIEDAKKVTPDGRVSYSSFAYHDAFAAIFSMIDFPTEVKDELNIDAVVSKAIRKAAVAGVINKDSVIDKLNEVVNLELATNEEEYFLLTSISLAGAFPFKKIQVGNTNIRLELEYPAKYKSRAGIIKSANIELEDSHKGYTKVIASTKARSVHGACNKAFRDIDVMRALLCLFTNATGELFGMSSHKPINRVRLGQAHTLHKKSGANATKGTVWYDESFLEAEPHHITKALVVSKNIKWALGRLAELKYSDILKDSLVRYVEALDEINHNTALTRLWGAIECIAAPSEPNCDAVPRRCSFLFEEHQYHRQVLEHLREFRNQSIHAGTGSNRAKSYCYQLQFYYREFILFHLHSLHDFNNLEQVNNFLDLPTDANALFARKKLIKRALRFRGINDE